MIGNTRTNTRTTTQQIEHFRAYIVQSGTCRIWAGCCDTNGYGRTQFLGRDDYTHRVAWQIAHGPIPPGYFVCHRCDNPPCSRAECDVPGCEHLKDSPGCQSHLFLGTAIENIADRHIKGRTAHGQKSPHRKLAEADVIAIRTRYAEGVSPQKLATEFSVSRATISNAVNHLTYRLVAALEGVA